MLTAGNRIGIGTWLKPRVLLVQVQPGGDTVSLKGLGCYGTDLNKNQTIYRDSHRVWLDVGSETPFIPHQAQVCEDLSIPTIKMRGSLQLNQR